MLWHCSWNILSTPLPVTHDYQFATLLDKATAVRPPFTFECATILCMHLVRSSSSPIAKSKCSRTLHGLVCWFRTRAIFTKTTHLNTMQVFNVRHLPRNVTPGGAPSLSRQDEVSTECAVRVNNHVGWSSRGEKGELEQGLTFCGKMRCITMHLLPPHGGNMLRSVAVLLPVCWSCPWGNTLSCTVITEQRLFSGVHVTCFSLFFTRSSMNTVRTVS